MFSGYIQYTHTLIVSFSAPGGVHVCRLLILHCKMMRSGNSSFRWPKSVKVSFVAGKQLYVSKCEHGL